MRRRLADPRPTRSLGAQVPRRMRSLAPVTVVPAEDYDGLAYVAASTCSPAATAALRHHLTKPHQATGPVTEGRVMRATPAGQRPGIPDGASPTRGRRGDRAARRP